MPQIGTDPLGSAFANTDSLNQIKSASMTLIETEFWGQIKEPNLLVEVRPRRSVIWSPLFPITKGKSGESIPPTLTGMDAGQCTKGAEVVGGQGGKAPDFEFATLYRVSRMEKGKIYLPWEGGRLLAKTRTGESAILDKLK